MKEPMPFFAASSTRILPLTKVAVHRMLPRAGQLHVRKDQAVTAGQVLGRSATRELVHIVPAARMLGVRPSEVIHFVVPEVGTTLQRGDLLLSRPGRFGRGKTFRTRVAGVLSHVRDGLLVIRPASAVYELRAMIDGVAARIFPGRGVVLETNGTLVQAWWHSGVEGRGPLQALSEDPDTELTVESSEAAAREAVVMAGRLSSPEVVDGLATAGVSGIICGSASAAAADRAVARELPMTLTEGIGSLPMAAPIFDLLSQCQERPAALLAEKAGRRPEVIIKVATDYEAALPQKVRPLVVGQMVRVWRLAGRPHVGRVKHIYGRPRRTALGQPMAGADVELADGQVVFVPFTNLDAIYTE